MKLTRNEKQIIQHLDRMTAKQLDINQKEIGITTVALSDELQIDRANVSRLLNNLCKEGVISKKITRPVLFISKQIIKERYPIDYIPSILNKNQFVYDFINKSNKNILSHKDHPLINPAINQDIYNDFMSAANSLAYPPYGLDVLIYGEKGCGKSEFINSLYHYCVKNGTLSETSELININCSFLTNESIDDTIDSRIYNQDANHLIILNNFESLDLRNREFLFNLLTDRLNSKRKHKRGILNHSYILVSSKELTESNLELFADIIPTIVKLPNINVRSVKEKMAFSLYFFQIEANNLQKPIYLSKNILNCFVMSHYNLNIHQLKNEIKKSLLSSHVSNQKKPILEIFFENITDRLLSSIPDINPMVDELNSIYETFNFSSIIIHPNETSEIFLKLCYQETMTSQKLTNEQVTPLSDDDKISLISRSDIIKSIETPLNSLKSSNVKETYELLKPALSETPLWTDKRIIYKLLEYINKLSSSISHEGNASNKNDVDYDFYHIDDLTKSVVEVISQEKNVSIPINSIKYIMYYIQYANAIINKELVSVIIVGNEEKTASLYSTFANSLPHTNQCKYYVLNLVHLEISFQKTIDQLVGFIHENSNNKGTILLCNDDYPENVVSTLSHKVPSLRVMNKFTIKQLESIMSFTSKPTTFLHDLDMFLEQDTRINNDYSYANLLTVITDKILTDLLTFINPHKISKVSFDFLVQTINDLQISNCEPLTIQFITHVAFMVERIRNNDILKYSDFNNYAIKNTRIFQTLEKNIQPLSRMFDIIVPQSELVYLTEIVKRFDKCEKN